MVIAVARAAARFVLPSDCLACGERPVDRFLEGGVCEACWRSIPEPGADRCARCDEALPGSSVPAVCGRCLLDPPAFETLRAAAPYRGASRDILLAFKFRGADYLGARLAGVMLRRLPPPGSEEIVCVPATARSRRARGLSPGGSPRLRAVAAPAHPVRAAAAPESGARPRSRAASPSYAGRRTSGSRSGPPAARRRTFFSSTTSRPRAPPRGSARGASSRPARGTWTCGASRAPPAPTLRRRREGPQRGDRPHAPARPEVDRAAVRLALRRGRDARGGDGARRAPERRGLHGDPRRARRGRHAARGDRADRRSTTRRRSPRSPRAASTRTCRSS